MNEPVLEIREERAEDRVAVRAVVEAAFGRAGEADLVDALREGGGLVVALVAEVGGRVVGHVAFSPVTIDGNAWPVVGLAPLAVEPEFQRRGLGALLAREGLARCRRVGAGAVVVLGDPAYYGRFGFGPAGSFGLRCVYEAPEEAFQVVELVSGALAGRSGLVEFRPEFGGVE